MASEAASSQRWRSLSTVDSSWIELARAPPDGVAAYAAAAREGQEAFDPPGRPR
jgi:hypothetical protein